MNLARIYNDVNHLAGEVREKQFKTNFDSDFYDYLVNKEIALLNIKHDLMVLIKQEKRYDPQKPAPAVTCSGETEQKDTEVKGFSE